MNSASPHNLVESHGGMLLDRVLAIARELHPEWRGLERLDADASIERAVGLDSLARVELTLRIERA